MNQNNSILTDTVFFNKTGRFISELLDISHSKSDDASTKLLSVLMKYLPIKACSFYSYYSMTGHLTLRAQAGLSYGIYKNFQLPMKSTAATALINKKAMKFDDVALCDDYIDKPLIRKYNLKKLLVVPFDTDKCIKHFSEEICQEFQGVLCIYPNDDVELDKLENLFNSINNILSSSYNYSVESDKFEIRRDIVSQSIYTNDLSSFLHKTLIVLRDKWNFEASSIFLVDERNNHLRLHATTGIDTDLKKIEIFYSNREINQKTVDTFLNKKINFLLSPQDDCSKGKYVETTKSKKKSVVFIPIPEPPCPYTERNRAIGVLRVVNRIVSREGVSHSCYFGWEDISLLVFVAEVVGIISFLFKKSQRRDEDFERAVHGLRSNVKTVKANLAMLVSHNITKLIPRDFQYAIPDSISFVEAFKWQIDKNTDREKYSKIDTKEIKLMGEVLSKLVVFIEDSYKAYKVKNLSLTNLKDSGFLELPTVKGNAAALQVVFRNLAENSMKYCDRNGNCSIQITWEDDGRFLLIYFSDYGIGIHDDDVENIFLEGYRSEEAMRKNPAGAGIGLAQTIEIMKNMGGDLSFRKDPKKTIFVVKLQKWL